MTDAIGDLLPSANALMNKLALAEAEKAEKEARKAAEAQAEKDALLAQFRNASGVSDEQAVRRAMVIIERAIGNGQAEVQVYRFPNALCTDGGRAINQHEPGWERTLTGVPREVYELWDRQFRPRGYKLKAEIVDFPGGVPGDVAFTLGWA